MLKFINAIDLILISVILILICFTTTKNMIIMAAKIAIKYIDRDWWLWCFLEWLDVVILFVKGWLGATILFRFVSSSWSPYLIPLRWLSSLFVFVALVFAFRVWFNRWKRRGGKRDVLVKYMLGSKVERGEIVSGFN